MRRDIIVREVGLRDGLQIIKPFMATEDKKTWCTKLVDAGVPEIEVTSLVPPKLIPQFSDAAEVVAHANSLEGLVASALIPNLRGAERAIELGVHKVTCIVSASNSFNLANVKRPTEESIKDFGRIVELVRAQPEGKRPKLIGGVSSAFGCTIEGEVPEKTVIELSEQLAEMGADEILLADTTGSGDPALVRRICGPLAKSLGDLPFGVHFHDTRGTGLANVVAALDCNVALFDASLGGIGGCPNSPGATGNIATEDLVFMVEAMGLRTGIDIDALIEIYGFVQKALPDVPLHGHIAKVGVPKRFKSAA